MSKLRKPPAYRLHKPTGQSVVRIDGHDHYLGKHGTEVSHEAYRRLIARWAAAPPSGLASARPSRLLVDLNVDQLIVAYWDQRVVSYYLKDGRPTSEQDNIRQALRFLRKLFGHTPAADFGPKALEAVRDSMITAGRCRTLINKDIHRIRGMFRWAASRELYPGELLHALGSLVALEKGRSGAKDRPPVSEVAEADVIAVLTHLTPQVAAMVRLQLLSAARPGEVCMIRPRDVDRVGQVWLYRPASHKTEHHGRERVIVLGPRGQEVLRPWLDRDSAAYCFSPVEVVAALGRRTCPGDVARRPGTRPALRPKPGGKYSKDSYRTAIQRACRRAGVSVWTPHQLRHTQATAIRRSYDVEAAQIILGHSQPDTTLIYASRDLERACQVMAAIG